MRWLSKLSEFFGTDSSTEPSLDGTINADVVQGDRLQPRIETALLPPPARADGTVALDDDSEGSEGSSDDEAGGAAGDDGGDTPADDGPAIAARLLADCDLVVATEPRRNGNGATRRRRGESRRAGQGAHARTAAQGRAGGVRARARPPRDPGRRG